MHVSASIPAAKLLFPADHPASGLAGDWLRDMDAMLKPPELPALQAQWRAQATLGGEFAMRVLDAWRQIVHANLGLARDDSDALLALSHQLLACEDAGRINSLLARHIEPAAKRWRLWQEQLLDACAGVQSNAALLAETWVPAASMASASASASAPAPAPAPAPARRQSGHP